MSPHILYIAAIRLPTEKAHGLQIMKMCEALASTGSQMELVVPGRKTHVVDDAFSYYKVEQRFSIHTCKTLDFVQLGRFGFLITTILFALRAAWYAKRCGAEVLYTRDRILALLLALLLPGTPLLFEVHGREPRWLIRLVARHAQFVAITGGVADTLVALGVAPEHVLVAHDAVDLSDFSNPESKAVARTRLGITQNAQVAMYIGRLDGWKGVGTLLEASKQLESVHVVIIGGEEGQVHELQERYPNVQFLGYRPYAELANNQVAADVLVLPNTATDETSVRFTSPLKLFTYMASKRPIVASDLPSLREVLDEESAYFVVPDDTSDLARGIMHALTDGEAAQKANQARTNVERYTWRSRAESIVRFLDQTQAARGIVRPQHRQVVKFAIAGGLSACTNFIILFVLTDLFHVYYLVSATVAFLAAFAVSFLLQKFWTFEHNTGRTHTQLMLYFIAAMVNLLITIGLLYVLTDVLHLWYMFSALVTAFLIAIGTFFLYRSVIFI
ncbi:MAG: Group 1 glycosyl transferase [Patescibacteria group bacterium]|nr:Group 1 glycosyl transferase [Patescibacteria group bacterium]